MHMEIHVGDWKKQPPFRLLFTVLGFISFVLLFLVHVEWFQVKFDYAFGRMAHVRDFHAPLLYYMFLGMLILMIWCGALAVQQWVLRKNIMQEGALRIKPLSESKALSESRIAVERIRHQNLSKFVITSFSETKYIYRNLDGEVRREWKMKAVDTSVNFYPINIRVKERADPVACLQDIHLRVEGQDAHREVVLLSGNSTAHEISALLVFVPPLDPNDKAPLLLTLEYEWKGMWRNLATDEHEDFQWSLDSLENIASVELEILVEPGIDRVFECNITRKSQEAGAKLESIERRRDREVFQWKGYKYSLNNAPGRAEHSILTTLRRPEPTNATR